MRRARVLLAEDHTLLLDAFAKLLEPHCDVVGTAGDGRELLEAAKLLEPDVVVADISMPLLNGLEAGRRLREILPDTKLVFVTVNEDPDLAAEALRMGASAYVLKKSATSELFHAIREVLAGRSYVTPLVAPDGLDGIRERKPRRAAELTPRQREVLQLLAEGKSMKRVADILNVTPRTVAFHKYRMMGELGFGSTAELVKFAVREGIVSA